MITGGFILTLTVELAGNTIGAPRTLLLTAFSSVACFTHTKSSHRVTAPITVITLTLISTQSAPATGITGPCTVMASPPWWARTLPSHMVTLGFVVTVTEKQAALPVVPTGASFFTGFSSKPRRTFTVASFFVTNGSICTHPTCKLTVYTPQAFRAVFLTGWASSTGRTHALTSPGVTGCLSTVTSLEAVSTKLPRAARKLASLSMEPWGTLALALSSLMVTGHTEGTVTLQLTASSMEPWSTLFLTSVAMVTRLANAGAIFSITFQGVFFFTLAFFRAPSSEDPFWTG